MTDIKSPESGTRTVRDIMTRDVVTVGPDASVSEIARLMWEHKISGLPVVNEQREVLGMVTELDLVVRNTRFKLPGFFTLLDATIYFETPRHIRQRLQHIVGVTAAEIMSHPATTIDADATIEQLSELMVDRRITPVAVLEGGRLVGIVSRADIVRLMAQSWEEPS